MQTFVRYKLSEIAIISFQILSENSDWQEKEES